MGKHECDNCGSRVEDVGFLTKTRRFRQDPEKTSMKDGKIDPTYSVFEDWLCDSCIAEEVTE